MAVSLASLLITETKDAIYKTALGVATAVGLDTSSWQAGDPTRSLYHVEAETLSTLETIVAGFVASGFLDYATGSWLEVLAKQVFNVDVPAATYATTDVALTNAGGGVYVIAAGDLTFKNSTTGKTYRNTTGGTLPARVGAVNGTLTVTVVADEAGAASSAGAGEINALVTTLLNVTCSNATAATGVDKQDEATTRAQCRAKLGALSPNGPRDAYAFVARDQTLSGTNAVTRVRAYGDSETGGVVVYLAGPSGGVAEADRALVETAVLKYATPLCITPTVLSATNVTVPVTYELWVYKSVNKTVAEIQSDVSAALQSMMSTRDIGGDIVAGALTGKLYKSLIESTIRSLYPQAFRVNVTLPAADVSLNNGEVAVLGTTTGTVNLVTNP